MWYDLWKSKDQVGCWNNIGSWFCFVVILTYFHLLGYVTKHIMLEHMNKLMNIPFGRLNILRKPQKCHTVWNVYCCGMEPMVVSNPFHIVHTPMTFVDF
jgi:hypothetical protein